MMAGRTVLVRIRCSCHEIVGWFERGGDDYASIAGVDQSALIHWRISSKPPRSQRALRQQVFPMIDPRRAGGSHEALIVGADCHRCDHRVTWTPEDLVATLDAYDRTGRAQTMKPRRRSNPLLRQIRRRGAAHGIRPDVRAYPTI